jgi:hypothetical protein
MNNKWDILIESVLSTVILIGIVLSITMQIIRTLS